MFLGGREKVYNQHGGAEVKKAQEHGDRTNKRERRDCIIKWVWQSPAKDYYDLPLVYKYDTFISTIWFKSWMLIENINIYNIYRTDTLKHPSYVHEDGLVDNVVSYTTSAL